MGYTRSKTVPITIHYSGSVSYPASQHGGSVSYHGSKTENVTVNIYVDTDPFDNSVRICNNNVSGLTTSVVTMSAAQVASIASNANQVGSTIVKGFFSTVSSEISQQIAELRSNIDATLLRLNELAKRCVDKQRQMQADYARITSRYLKIFDDLDKECENRIFEIDRPTFIFKRTTDETAERAICNDMVTTAAVSGGENSIIEAQICASHTKRKAMAALSSANNFLMLQRKTQEVISHSTFNDDAYGVYYAPVCYIETKENQKYDRQAYPAESLSMLDNTKLVEQIKDLDLGNSSSKELQADFHHVVGSHYAYASGHDARVRDYVTKLFKSNLNK